MSVTQAASNGRRHLTTVNRIGDGLMAKRNPSTGKPPAFQFYPAEFLADEDQAVMTFAECGLYTRLLCYAWGNGSIPDDVFKMAKLLGSNADEVCALWPAVSVKFSQHPSDPTRLVNPRMERERAKQAKFRKHQEHAAAMRWHSAGNASAIPAHRSGNAAGNALVLSDLVLSEVQEKSARTRASVDRKKTASNPTYANMKAWTAECHELHADSCHNQREHVGKIRKAVAS